MFLCPGVDLLGRKCDSIYETDTIDMVEVVESG
jgi:hypothetical protein